MAALENADPFWIADLIYMFQIKVPNREPIELALVDWYTHALNDMSIWKRYREPSQDKRYIRFILLSDIENRCYFLPYIKGTTHKLWSLLPVNSQWNEIIYITPIFG